MAGVPSEIEIIRILERRIARLERLLTSTVDPTVGDGPAITGFSGTATYSVANITGLPTALVTWTWTKIPTPTVGDLDPDPVVDYFLSVTLTTDPKPGVFQSTNNENSVITRDIPLSVGITGRVYAVTAKGKKGPVSTVNLVINKDTTPPPQPSTPILTDSVGGGIVVKYDGLTSTGIAMPSDYKHCAVHFIYGTNTAFLPTSANFHGFLRVGQTFITSNSNYDPITVRLVAYDESGNQSAAASTGVTITPTPVVATLDGVVLPGAMGYNDIDNLLIDGSFEVDFLNELRISYRKEGNWYVDTTGLAFSRSKCLAVTGDAVSNKYTYLLDSDYDQLQYINVEPGQQLYISAWVRSISANGTFYISCHTITNAGVSTYPSVVTRATTDGEWAFIEGVVTMPADAKRAAPYVGTSSHTTGNWYVDAVTVRRVIEGVIIKDAAITTAKIADLAVKSAKIESLNAGKIQGGYIDAAVIEAGSITGNALSIGAVNKVNLGVDVSDQMDSISANLSSLNNVVTVDSSGVVISDIGSTFSVHIDNDSLDFKDGDSVVAYIDTNTMYIANVTVLDNTIIGNHKISRYDAQTTTIKWVG